MESEPQKHPQIPEYNNIGALGRCSPQLLQSARWLRENLDAFLRCYDVAPAAQSAPSSTVGCSQAIIDTLDFLNYALRQYHNNLSRIAQLPNEILSEIFHRILGMDLIHTPPPFSPCSWELYYHQVQQLRQVSRSWDSLICSDPRLWTFVSSGASPSNIRIHIARSKALPLSLVLEDSGDDGSEFLRETLPIMQRTRSIQAFKGYSKEVAQKMFNAPTPMLRILQIDGSPPSFPESEYITQLQSLRLRSSSIPPGSHEYPTLRALTLHAPVASMGQIVKFLSHCPVLEELEISKPHENQSGTTSHVEVTFSKPLHYLRHVTLREVSATAINTFLKHVDTSCCASITIQLPLSTASSTMELLRSRIIPAFVCAATAVEWQVQQRSFTCRTPATVIKLEFVGSCPSSTRSDIVRTFNPLFQQRPISLHCHLKHIDKAGDKGVAPLHAPLQFGDLLDLSNVIESEGTAITEVRWSNLKGEEFQRFRSLLLAFNLDSKTTREGRLYRSLKSLSTLVFDGCETNIRLLRGLIENRAETWFTKDGTECVATFIHGVYVLGGEVVGGGVSDEFLQDLGVRVHILGRGEAERVPALPDKVIVCL